MALAFEGRVENGQIHLDNDVTLPEHTQVVVVVREEELPPARVGSPRLANPEQIVDFKKTLIKIDRDGAV